jgi:hypothetical protein
MRWLKVVANFRFNGGRLTSSDMITGSTLCYSRYVRIRRLDEKIAILYCHGRKTGVRSKVHKQRQTRKFLDKHVCSESDSRARVCQSAFKTFLTQESLIQWRPLNVAHELQHIA